ncbi:class I SAM-dependent methyltransferase [Arthrobacter sp. CDRTa11]|uniref:class I SAM-dependent methyltransferase n=1 Tax=Arthrobacter sp. CDRTa11 TaxID=2651199 RepID=UPI002265C349|nr:class I SAM-dependent methyltransferase [Arthrobacter sp. CDRTa11]
MEFLTTLFGGCQTIIDLGCGLGRHACRLSARGLTVIGVDAAPKPNGLNFRYVKSDLSQIPCESESADALYSMYSSLDYDRDISKQLREWSRIAKPKAILVIDLANRGSRLKLARDSFEGGKGRMISLRFRERRYQCNLSRRWNVISVHSFSYPEPRLPWMLTALAEAGWHNQSVFGDFDFSAYTTKSPRLIVVACRR